MAYHVSRRSTLAALKGRSERFYPGGCLPLGLSRDLLSGLSARSESKASRPRAWIPGRTVEQHRSWRLTPGSPRSGSQGAISKLPRQAVYSLGLPVNQPRGAEFRRRDGWGSHG